MMWRQITLARVLCLISSLSCRLPAQNAGNNCPTVATRLVTQLVATRSLSDMPRVEIRRCEADMGHQLKLLAWATGPIVDPTLSIDTYEFTIIQTVARGNVFVIETTGGPRDTVFVIEMHRGKPRLSWRIVTRGTAEVTVTGRLVRVAVNGIYAGDAPPRQETREFPIADQVGAGLP